VGQMPCIRKPGNLPAQETDGRTGCVASGVGAQICVAARAYSLSFLGMDMAATLYVCATCKADQLVPIGALPLGAQLLGALLAADCPEGVTIKSVECLSACSNGCAVALQSTGKWGYVYGRLTPDDVPDILAGAAAYAEAPDGIVPWRARPTIFRKQSLARIPPQDPRPVEA